MSKDKSTMGCTDNIDELLDVNLSRIQAIEKLLWADDPNEILLAEYHAAFQHQEQLIAGKGADPRHEFIAAISAKNIRIKLPPKKPFQLMNIPGHC